MVRRLLISAGVLALSLWVVFGGLLHAQTLTDERFEKLAKELYPKAQQEGEVILYTSHDVEDVVAIFDAFRKQFPGIKTNYWQARAADVISRVMMEFQAGQASLDVIMGQSAAAISKAAGAVMPYKLVQDDALILSDPSLPVVFLQVQALAYNKEKLKGEDVPKKLEDVINAKYKGAVALDDPMRGSGMSIQLATLKEYWKDDARWTRFVKGLKDLNVPVHRSTGAMFRLLVSGEYSLALPAYLEDIIDDREKGGIIDYVKSDPPIVSRQYAAIYAKSPHPNAAKLLVEWMVSPAGQTVLDSVRRTPSRKGFPSRKASLELYWPPGTPIIAGELTEFLVDPKKWMDTYIKPIW